MGKLGKLGMCCVVLAGLCFGMKARANQDFNEDFIKDWAKKDCVDGTASVDTFNACKSITDTCQEKVGLELRQMLIDHCGVIAGNGFSWDCDDTQAAAVAKKAILLESYNSAPNFVKMAKDCQNNTPTLTCGNHKFDAGEECEDGNNKDGDGCSFDCKLEDGVVGKYGATNNTVNYFTELWCEQQLADPAKKAEPACSETFQACEKEVRSIIEEELAHKCGSRVLTGPDLSKDYIYYCDEASNGAIAKKGPKTASQFAGKFADACSSKADGGDTGTDNPGSPTGGSTAGDSTTVDAGGKAPSSGLPSAVSMLSGGGCTLASFPGESGSWLSLLLGAAFGIPLLPKRK